MTSDCDILYSSRHLQVLWNRVKNIYSYIETLSDSWVVDEHKYLPSIPSARSSPHPRGLWSQLTVFASELSTVQNSIKNLDLYNNLNYHIR